MGVLCHPPSATPPPLLTCRMDFRTPDLLDVWLEPPEDVFSTGPFLELGLHCPPPEVPVTRLQEQGLQGWKSSGGHGCVSYEWEGRWVETQLCAKPKKLQPPLAERSEDRSPKIDRSFDYSHVQKQKGLTLKHEGSRVNVR